MIKELLLSYWPLEGGERGVGNASLLDKPLIAFFASRKCSGGAIRAAMAWAVEQARKCAPMKNNNLCQDSSLSGIRRFRPFPGAPLSVLCALLLLPFTAHSAVITPFYTQNQSPVALIFGLPAPDNAAILGKGEWSGILAMDVANNFATDANNNEAILLDGESYRIDLALRYGIAKGSRGGSTSPTSGSAAAYSTTLSRDGTASSASLRGVVRQHPTTGSSTNTPTTARPGCCSTTPARASGISACQGGCSSTTTNGRTRAR